MRVAVIRHGVGREADKVLPFLEYGIYKEIQEINDINLEFFYLFREIKNENSILNNEKKVSSCFAKLDYEKLVEVNLPTNNYMVDFQSIFSNDINGDKFQNYGFLQNQCYMFKQFINLIDIQRFDSFIVLRDDTLIQPYRKIEKLVNNSTKGYVTSIWDWEAGVHDRFYMCPRDLFFKLSFKYDMLKSINVRNGKVNPRKYTGEKITLEIIKKNRYKIYPYNLKTHRVRVGPKIAPERHRIRAHDPQEVFNIFYNLMRNRIMKI